MAGVISIHALLAESDRNQGKRGQIQAISIHALLAESDEQSSSYNAYLEISIHALLAESDLWVWMGGLSRDISIHALLAESDITLPVLFVKNVLFLSTLSLRRATALSLPFGAVWIISIHALLAESDNKNLLLKRSRFIFLSTLSLRRATEHTNNGSNANLHFYPRSPCGERPVTLDFKSLCHYFYPRSPCGERPLNPRVFLFALFEFLSTLSLRRATWWDIKDNQ